MTNSSNQNNTRYSRLLIAAFVATLMLPACVLIFTDGYSFLRALSAVLLPTGFYLLWSVAHKRSGMMVCWGLLWFILAALQLVLLYMFGPIKATGIAIAGISVERKSCKKMKTTKNTSMNASNNVFKTS